MAARENAIAVENVGVRHQQIIGKNEKCNCRRAPATGAQTRSPGVGDGEGDRPMHCLHIGIDTQNLTCRRSRPRCYSGHGP